MRDKPCGPFPKMPLFLSITSAISAFSGSSALKIDLRILLRAKLTVKSRLLAYS